MKKAFSCAVIVPIVLAFYIQLSLSVFAQILPQVKAHSVLLLAMQQYPNIDSLHHLASTATDTSKVNTLNAIAYQLKRRSPIQTQQYATQALDLARSLRYAKGEMLARKNLGIAAYITGAYATALIQYTRALRLADSLDNEVEYANILNNIGLIQVETGSYDDALKNFREALGIHQKMNYALNTANSANSVGDAYFRQQQYDLALHYYLLADSAYRATAPGYTSSLNTVALGRTYIAIGTDMQRGLATLRAGIEQSIKEEDNFALIDGLLSLGRYYIQNEHKPTEARIHLNRADTIAQKFNILTRRIEVYKLLADAEKQSGNIARALEVREQLTLLRDSLIFHRRDELFGGIEELHRYESHRSEESIRVLNRERERDQLYQSILLVSIIVIGTTLIIGAIQYRKRIASEHALAERGKELDSANTTLQETNNRLQIQSQQLHSTNAALQQTNREFEQANTMKIKLLSVASHDLKNPLMNVRSLAEILSASTDGENHEFAKEIESLSVRMLEMIGDLLDRAAMESGNMSLNTQEFSFADMVRATVHQFTPGALKKEQSLTLAGEDSVIIIGDERKLRQVADNLISNAIKYSPFGARIEILLHHISDEIVRLEVQDQGPGLTEEDKAKAFGFFQKLSAKPTGGESSHGVGLSSVKHIVELHHGKVWVESTFGQGATFIVELPIRQPSM